MASQLKDFKGAYRPVLAPEAADTGYQPPVHETKLLPAGWRRSPENAAFVVDTIWEKDVPITLRDGTKIYADIFRPATDEKVPALLTWSPYGKSAMRMEGKLILYQSPHDKDNKIQRVMRF
jgi:predicted acyl esterase